MGCSIHKKQYCRDCNFGFCPHNKRKNRCKECGGSGVCEHGRCKGDCKECGGSSICEHGRKRQNCKECNDPILITISLMIRSAKQRDKNNNLYDLPNFIDRDFLKNLIEDAGDKCCYCSCELQYRLYQSNLCSLERIDNTLGHIKTNCKIACLSCNVGKVGQR